MYIEIVVALLSLCTAREHSEVFTLWPTPTKRVVRPTFCYSPGIMALRRKCLRSL